MAANFEDLEARLFAATDDLLGDTIQVKIPPADFVARKGFVLFDGAAAPAGGFIDPLNMVKRLKLSKSYFAGEPDRDVRFRHAKLGAGTFQIAGDVDAEGQNYVFDVQEAGD
jgi:hypothetical protein